MKFIKTRDKAIKSMKAMEKKGINVYDRHDAIWLLWNAYHEQELKKLNKVLCDECSLSVQRLIKEVNNFSYPNR